MYTRSSLIKTASGMWGGLLQGKAWSYIFQGIILCCVDILQFQGFGPIPFHFG